MAKGESMSIWTDAEGRIHVGIMAERKRIHRKMPKGSTARDAKLLEANLRKSIGKREVNIPCDPPLTAVMALYLDHAQRLRSPKTAEQHALRAGPWCQGYKASDAKSVASRMIADMHAAYAPATINRTLGAMKTALTIAYRRDMTPVDYGDKIKRMPENNARHIYLSIDQVKRLADCCSDQVRAAVWIALLTGCRRGEILKLDTRDIQGDRLRIQSGNTKTLRERAVPIVPALRPWLEYIPLQISFEGLKSGFVRGRKKAGIDANFHDLRHSCASLLINMGVPLEVIRDILWHTTVKTTERYAHLQVDKQADALRMLSDAVSR